MSDARTPLLIAPSALGLASLIATPGSSEKGGTDVVKAGPEFEIVDQDPLDEPVGASAAVAGGRIDIRSHQHLFAIGSLPAS